MALIIMGLVLGLPLMALGIWSGRREGRKLGEAKAKAKAAQAWPQTQAKILSHDVRETKRRGDSGYVYESEALIRYSYVADGVERQGTRIRFAKVAFITPALAQKLLDKWPVGATVPIF